MISLWVQRASLQGPFISDDFKDIVNHPFMGGISTRNIAALLNPWSDAHSFTGNYAPVHQLAHMLERLLFGNEMLGYHVVNNLVHALNATLLVALLRRSSIPPLAAVLGGAFMLVHPASVEAVAWVSQLKTDSAMAFCLGALLLQGRRDTLALLCFTLGLLSKTSAVAALPAAAAFAFAWGLDWRKGRWILGWTLAFGIYAITQLDTYATVASYTVTAYEDPWVHMRSILAFWMRYIAMAGAAVGISAFQEPGPAMSWLDPWWLGGLAITLVLATRTLVCLSTRREEAAWWIFAAAGFGPISQLFPFLYPMGDRYLYFILPGLIGGTLLWGRDIRQRFSLASSDRRRQLLHALTRALVFATCGVLAIFALRSAERAALWTNEQLLVEEGIRNYPKGEAALFKRACEAGRESDVDEAVSLLQAAADRGVNRFNDLPHLACFSSIRDAPSFQAFIEQQTLKWLAEADARGVQMPEILLTKARAWASLGRGRKARRAYQEVIALNERLTATARRELDALQETVSRRKQRRRATQAAPRERSKP
ncbi:hypothetical protein MK489_15810 [Myxococcota bacterium]|nr:hypothetical protein [Myxococcota bacterium]